MVERNLLDDIGELLNLVRLTSATDEVNLEVWHGYE